MARSAAMRPPPAMTAAIVPQATMPAAQTGATPSMCSCRLGLATRKNNSSGKTSENVKNRTLRTARSIS